jgi:hypothetical protein
MLLGFEQHLSVECFVFLFLFDAEHYHSLETATTNVGQHNPKVDIFYTEL